MVMLQRHTALAPLYLLLWSCFLLAVSANTEIVMVDGNALQQLPSLPAYTDLGHSLVLQPSEPLSLVATVPDSSKPSTTWLRLALPARQPIATRHEKPSQLSKTLERIPGARTYTVRLSWPASSPAHVKLDTFTKGYGDAWLRVSIEDDSSAGKAPTSSPKRIEIPYTLMLERAYLGFIPESSLSMLLAVVGVVIMLSALGMPGRLFKLLRESEARHAKED